MGLSVSQLRGKNGGGSASLVTAEAQSLPDGKKVIGRAKISLPSTNNSKMASTAEALLFRPTSYDKTNDLFVWGGVLARLEKVVASIPRYVRSWYYWIGLWVGLVCTTISVLVLNRFFGYPGRMVGYVVGSVLTAMITIWAHRRSPEHKCYVVQSKETVDAAMTELRTMLPSGYTLMIQREEDGSSTVLIDLCRSDTVVGPLPPVDRAVELHLPLSLDMFTKTTRHNNDGFDIWTHGAIMVTLRTFLEPYTKADNKRTAALSILTALCYIFWVYPGGLIANNSDSAWCLLGIFLGVGAAAVTSLVGLYSNIVEGPGRHAKCQQCLAEVTPAVYDRIGYHMTYDVVPIDCSMGMTRGVLNFSRTTTPTTGGITV